MKATEVWKDAIERAVDHGFDPEAWDKKYDEHIHQKALSQMELISCTYAEAFVIFLSYVKMKAVAFSQEFALCFFPREICEDPECFVCKEQGGHYKYVTHMKNMCEYADFTAYLEIILDGED